MPDASGLARPESAGWAAVADAPAYGSPEVAGWADGPDVPAYAPPGTPGWADGPDVPAYAPPETPGWPEAPDAPGTASPEVGDWAAAPVAPGHAPPEAPDWAEAADQPDPAGWPAETDPGYDRPGPGHQRTGARRGNRAGDPRGPRRAPSKQTRSKQARPTPGRQPVRQPPRTKNARKTRRRLSWPVLALAAASAIAVGAVAILLTNNSGGGAAHTLTTPVSLGAYVKQPQLAEQMHAATLRQQILQQSAGEANNVIYAVYEDSTGSAATSGPQIFLFIGGNLKGTSAGAFISTFTGKVPDAQTTSAGSLGGAAACFPSVNGRLAGCVWADDDTFGLVASQTLSSTGLANEMRQMRPMVEHRANSAQ